MNIQEIDGNNPDNLEYLQNWEDSFGGYMRKIKKQLCYSTLWGLTPIYHSIARCFFQHARLADQGAKPDFR